MAIADLGDDFYHSLRGVMLHPALTERTLEQLTVVSDKYRINPFDVSEGKTLSVAPVNFVGDWDSTTTDPS